MPFRLAAIPLACLALAGPALAGSPVAKKPPAPMWLLGVEPEMTGSVTPASPAAAPARAPCPPPRRVGTGAGFCLIN